MEQSIEKLINDLKDPDETIRRYAAEDLGFQEGPEVVPHLVEALSDSAVSVREAGTDSLIAIGGREVCERVVPLLESEEASIRNYAIEILGKTGDAALDLISSLCDSANSDLRIFVLDILGKIGANGEHNILEKCAGLLDDENVNVAAKAAETIGNIGDPAGVPFLTEKINSCPWVQTHILLAIANLGGDKAEEFFENTNPDEFPQEVQQHFNIAKIMLKSKKRENAK